MNKSKMDAFVGEILRDVGACYGMALVRMGGELGLYEALYQHGPLGAEGLARCCELNERYVREWLSNQAAAGYVEYDRESCQFWMTDEQAAVLVDSSSPFFLLPAFDAAAAALGNQSKVQRAFVEGGGVGWGDQTGCLFCAVAEFFRPGYEANLVHNWLPALDGVIEKLERGARVADIGCGHGVSTRIMAQAFPNSEFIGYDFHEKSVNAATSHAMVGSNPPNLRYAVATAKDFPGKDYDLVTLFDCLHDMGDPAGAAAHIKSALKAGGTLMVVEPFAQDELADNLNPIGRIYYAASTMICVPTSMDQEVGTALGAQAGERALREVIVDQGEFARLRRAAETPFNLVLEARPS